MSVPAPSSLTRKRKAALIVQMIVSGGDKLPLATMPISVQKSLTDELGDIRLVDKSTVSDVAAEFLRELDNIGLIAPGGAENVLKTLGDHISPSLANELRTNITNAKMQDPWAMIAALETDELTNIMQHQSIEIASVVLSKLTVSKAAEVLGLLPGALARRITYAISQTAAITPDAVARIGAALVQEHCGTAISAFDKAPTQRVSAILNSSPAKTRDDMLEGLVAADTPFAEDVRKAIFTFADVPTRLVPTDIASCIRGVSPETLNIAIGGAIAQGGPLEEAAEFVLANISQRMAGQIREEIDELGRIKPSDADQAMNALTAAIRDLADAGTIKFVEPETEDDDS